MEMGDGGEMAKKKRESLGGQLFDLFMWLAFLFFGFMLMLSLAFKWTWGWAE